MLNTIPTTLLAPRQLSGLFLSKNKLPPKARARLAAEILEQRAVVTKLTVGQIASLCRVSVSSVNAARGGRGRKPADLTLARIWGRATPQQRLEFIRCAGPDAVRRRRGSKDMIRIRSDRASALATAVLQLAADAELEPDELQLRLEQYLRDELVDIERQIASDREVYDA
jgi:hypothetical protein